MISVGNSVAQNYSWVNYIGFLYKLLWSSTWWEGRRQGCLGYVQPTGGTSMEDESKFFKPLDHEETNVVIATSTWDDKSISKGNQQVVMF